MVGFYCPLSNQAQLEIPAASYVPIKVLASSINYSAKEEEKSISN